MGTQHQTCSTLLSIMLSQRVLVMVSVGKRLTVPEGSQNKLLVGCKVFSV